MFRGFHLDRHERGGQCDRAFRVARDDLEFDLEFAQVPMSRPHLKSARQVPDRPSRTEVLRPLEFNSHPVIRAAAVSGRSKQDDLPPKSGIVESGRILGQVFGGRRAGYLFGPGGPGWGTFTPALNQHSRKRNALVERRRVRSGMPAAPFIRGHPPRPLHGEGPRANRARSELARGPPPSGIPREPAGRDRGGSGLGFSDVSSLAESLGAERIMNARGTASRLASPGGPLSTLGRGAEAVALTDGTHVDKVFDYWKTRDRTLAFLRPFAGRSTDSRYLYPILALHESGHDAVLV